MSYAVCLAAEGGTDHSHVAFIDPRTGNGRTDPGPDGHVHEIIRRDVQAGGAEGHSHPLVDCDP